MKTEFSLSASKQVFQKLETAADRAAVSRGQAFEYFLTFVRCSLAGQTMEEEYLETVARGYANGEQSKRGIDAMAEAFGALVLGMEKTGEDLLGDIFQGAITYGEQGQFFTPSSITQLMATMTTTGDDSQLKRVNDPACGSGRTLLSVGKNHPNWEYTGQDIDHRCVQMTAINLGLHGLKGWAVWKNTLTAECHRVYRIGFNLNGGVIREVALEESPFDYAKHKQALGKGGSADTHFNKEITEISGEPSPEKGGQQQLDLF